MKAMEEADLQESQAISPSVQEVDTSPALSKVSPGAPDLTSPACVTVDSPEQDPDSSSAFKHSAWAEKQETLAAKLSKLQVIKKDHLQTLNKCNNNFVSQKYN